MVFIKRFLHITIATIGCSALAFQTAVLLPYHDELDVEFKKIRDMEAQDKQFYEFEFKAM